MKMSEVLKKLLNKLKKKSMAKEIKLGTIVEVVANTGDPDGDVMIGQFAKVIDMTIHEGRVYYILDKFQFLHYYEMEICKINRYLYLLINYL